MKLVPIVFGLSIFISFSICGTIIKEENERVHDHKLSDEKHYTDKDGDKAFEHNVDYDHEAFLGKEEADKFKSLTPEESKERLSKIVDKIDNDHDDHLNESELHEWLKAVKQKVLLNEIEEKWNITASEKNLTDYIDANYGALKYCNLKTLNFNSFKLVDKIDRNHDFYVSEHELRSWIRQQHKNYLQKNSEKNWKKKNKNLDNYLTFDELISDTIGGEDSWTEEEKETKKDLYNQYLKMMERDKRRFKAADLDADGKLSKIEFGDFLHPEESKTMKDYVINETISDLDKNGDGLVSLEEYGLDIKKNLKPGEDEPEWMIQEIENFRSVRDKNKDGVMDREEVGNWILPDDFDHTLNEAKHLIYEADTNKDGKLSKKEILDHYNLFVASQATNYGRAIYEKEDL